MTLATPSAARRWKLLSVDTLVNIVIVGTFVVITSRLLQAERRVENLEREMEDVKLPVLIDNEHTNEEGTEGRVCTPSSPAPAPETNRGTTAPSTPMQSTPPEESSSTLYEEYYPDASATLVESQHVVLDGEESDSLSRSTQCGEKEIGNDLFEDDDESPPLVSHETARETALPRPKRGKHQSSK